MKEVRRFHAERQVQEALAARNGPRTTDTLDLPLQSIVRVWREKKGWTGPYRLLAVEGETCTIDLPHGPTNFRSTVVKPFYRKEVPENIMPQNDASRDLVGHFLTLGQEIPPDIQGIGENSDPDHSDVIIRSRQENKEPPLLRTTWPVVEIPVRREQRKENDKDSNIIVI